ncbi:MAG: mannose-1-phosphate guanylyltransferase/mannose-6-phosphate isomerase [Cyanobacteria bacterium SIG29]|nr:mannose-1-phosphate guanylyltransferase/mannose-6-phosphate isomerase [Cyanobacteria bacterium SIG29]
MATVFSVILAGGSGSRLWPQSREAYPKQIFKLDDEYTLFQQTFLRVASVIDDKNIITCTNMKQSSAIKEQLKVIQEKFSRQNEYKVITEPLCKNTAPAIALTIKYIQEKIMITNNSPIILAIPSDHIIPNREEFSEIIEKGIKLANEGYIVAFGQKTNNIDKNFGYFKARKNPKVTEIEPSASKVIKFIEKPSKKDDIKVLKGTFYTNTGIYMFRADTYLDELKRFAPNIYKTIKNGKLENSTPSIQLSAYENLEDISVDYAIMENSKKLVTLPFETQWKDIGSWDAIYELSKKDENGNYFTGKTIDIDSKNSMVYSTSKTVATLGLENTIVVETEDAILVCDKDKTDSIKNIYKKLNGKNAPAKEIHKTVYRPWGYYTVLEEGIGFLTKCIVVNPNAKLSIQLHHHRSEHWIILEGIATVVKGEETYRLEAGTSIDIGIEEIHSLQNLDKEPLKVLEIQQGDILDENDIERLEDIYGRA